MFWDEHIEGWRRGGTYPRRLACIIEDESEHDKISVECGGAVRAADSGWVASPERRAVITGTRDELFSRALGRGYGVRQARWSMYMGLLNNDTMWVMRRPDPVFEGLGALHRRYGAYRVSASARGGPAAHIPIRKLFDTDSGGYADIEEYVEGGPPDIIDPPRTGGGGELWVSLADHLSQAEGIMAGICAEIPLGFTPELLRAARYHDWAKSHHTFQGALLSGADPGMRRTHWAKRRPRIRLVLDGFYHDLVGGCAMACSGTASYLESYLVMTHHGKFHTVIPRVSDELPETPLGGGIIERATSFEMEPRMWARISKSLYRRHGPFVLTYLESLLRAADIRASTV